MTTIFLLEIPARTGGSPDTQTLRVATWPGYNHPSAPGIYPADLVQPGLIKRHIVASGPVGQGGSILGESDISFGENVLQNIEGDYDEYFTYGYGDAARLLIGDSDGSYGSFVTVQVGKVEQPDGNEREIVFRWRGREAELDLPVSPATYAGDNLESPSSGLEGTADDLKGQNKIRIFGEVYNLAPDPVNTAENIFAVNHDKNGDPLEVSAIDTARVNGSDWSVATDRTSVAALFAAAPAQGYYDTATDFGLMKMGGTIGSGQVTADVVEVTSLSDRRVAYLIQRLLEDAGVDSGDIDSGAKTQLDTDANYKAGIVLRGETYREAIDAIRAGAAAWVAPNRLGVYVMKQIKAPSGTPAATFRRFDYPNVAAEDDFAIQSLEKLAPSDDGRGVPVWQVTVNYLRMWQVQDVPLEAAVSEADKAKYGREYRSVTVEDATIQNQFPLARSLTVDTLLVEQADAAALAAHLLDLLGTRRDLFRLVARYDAPLAAAIDLGDVVEVFYPRFGLSGGKLFNVHGIQYDARKFEVELELWG